MIRVCKCPHLLEHIDLSAASPAVGPDPEVGITIDDSIQYRNPPRQVEVRPYAEDEVEAQRRKGAKLLPRQAGCVHERGPRRKYLPEEFEVPLPIA